VLEGNTPRFPRTKIVPSATMLSSRLSSTTEGSGSPQHTAEACACPRKRARTGDHQLRPGDRRNFLSHGGAGEAHL